MSKVGRRNARSVPLKGIHRLFSEAEQVRFIVARVHVGGSAVVAGCGEEGGIHEHTHAWQLSGPGEKDVA